LKHYISDYPRPQLVRTDWVNLNGKWDFAFDDANAGEKLGWQKGFSKQYDIEVPFTYETKLSGIGQQEPHEHVWYAKTLNVKKHDGRVLLHFEAAITAPARSSTVSSSASTSVATHALPLM